MLLKYSFRPHIETNVHIFYFRKIFLHRANQIIISGFNDSNTDTSVVRSQNTKRLHEHKENRYQINNSMILITEWNHKCNEKLHIPYSTTSVIMVTTPWFCVLVGSTVSLHRITRSSYLWPVGARKMWAAVLCVSVCLDWTAGGGIGE